MGGKRDIDFGFVAAPSGKMGLSDLEMYDEILADCELGQTLGYSTAWMIEHHFSDYYPTPSPMSFLPYIAARFPKLALGTCVLVTPWYDPLRLAEEIAQLNALTSQPLHLGLGRGTAKMEYDAFGIDMDTGRTRFRECYEILKLALAGGKFTYAGEALQVPKEVELRPRTEASKVHFYGAIGGSPESAQIMADIGIPPICTTIFDFEKQATTLAAWREKAKANGANIDVQIPLMVNAIIADTDEEAIEQAKTYIPPFMQAQVDHYEADKDHYRYLETYKAWSRIFAGMKNRCNPESMPGWAEYQLVGSVETVRNQVARYVEAGFNSFLLHIATTGVPAEKRHEWMTRFAREVAPAFSSAFAGGPAEVASVA